MTNPSGTTGAPSTATFHMRVAKVGLITAVVVLAAACTTFMLQQWAVARTQSHAMHQALAEVGVETAANTLALGDNTRASAVVAALARTKTILAVRLDDAQGHAISSFDRRSDAKGAETEVITRDAMVAG